MISSRLVLYRSVVFCWFTYCLADALIIGTTETFSFEDRPWDGFERWSYGDPTLECSLNYTRFEGVYLKGAKMVNYRSYKVTSLEKCVRKCCCETRFQCASFTFTRLSKICYIMNISSENVGTRLKIHKGWIHGQVISQQSKRCSLKPEGVVASLRDSMTFTETLAELWMNNLFTLSSLIRSRISHFYKYAYDGGNDPFEGGDGSDYQISDGGRDMYDIGNRIVFSSNHYKKTKLRYGESYSNGTFSLTSQKSHPFMAVAVFQGNLTFEVESNPGADGYGSMIVYSASKSTSSISVQFKSVQIFRTPDPVICELFVFFKGRKQRATMNVVTEAETTSHVVNRAHLSAVKNEVHFAYILLSRKYGYRKITKEEVVRVVNDIVGFDIEFSKIEEEYFN